MEQQTGSKLEKKYHQGSILLSCLFNLYVEYIMRIAWLDEVQAGIKSVWRNIMTPDTQMATPLWQEMKN